MSGTIIQNLVNIHWQRWFASTKLEGGSWPSLSQKMETIRPQESCFMFNKLGQHPQTCGFWATDSFWKSVLIRGIPRSHASCVLGKASWLRRPKLGKKSIYIIGARKLELADPTTIFNPFSWLHMFKHHWKRNWENMENCVVTYFNQVVSNCLSTSYVLKYLSNIIRNLSAPGKKKLFRKRHPNSVLQILQGQASVLGRGLLSLQGILRPDALGVHKLSFPGLHLAGSWLPLLWSWKWMVSSPKFLEKIWFLDVFGGSVKKDILKEEWHRMAK